MAEPWDITSAFARQLMQDAADRDRTNTGLAMTPINQALAMERLKQQAAIELATYGAKLPLETQALRERGINETEQHGTRTVQTGEQTRQTNTLAHQQGEEARIAAEQRGLQNLPKQLRIQTEEKLKAAGEDAEQRIKIMKQYGAEAYKQAGLTRGAGSNVGDPLLPPLMPGADTIEALPTDFGQREVYIDNLKASGAKIIHIGAHRGHNYIHYKKAGPTPTNVSSSMNDPPTVKNPLAPTPVTPRPAANVPFDDVTAAGKSALTKAMGGAAEQGPPIPDNYIDRSQDVNQPIPNAPIPPSRPVDLGGKDKLSFLYESIRRRGYSDDEAKSILADMQKKPDVKPTSDPDIFDVLVT